MKYLGLRLLSKRLSVVACAPLIQAIIARLQTWKAKLLSYAGRVELIRSVLSSMHLYWTSIFILPVNVLQAIDKAMLRFLWDGHGQKRSVFISWWDVCRLRDEGGLGIWSTRDCNLVGILQLLWEVVTDRDTIWVNGFVSSILEEVPFGVRDLLSAHPGPGETSFNYIT